MKHSNLRGFSFLELIITIVIISIIFGTGAILITSSTKNYFEQKKLNLGQSVKNININRFSNYVIPIFKNLHQPLYFSEIDGEIIIASANIEDFQSLNDDNTYMSQLIKFRLIDTDIVMETYLPAENGGADLLYQNSSTDFNDLTANTLIANSTTIAKNITSISISYLDIDATPTTTASEINFIKIEISILSSTVARTRTIVISPWRLLL